MPIRLLLASFILSVSQSFSADLAPLRLALKKQAEHKTVSVDVRQTKKIPALAEEIVQRGHLWMKPGEAFRWELGEPVTQRAVYDGEKVVLLDVKKKTGVRLDPDDRRAKPLMLMLGIDEGATFDGLQETFTIAGTNMVEEHFIVSLVPKGKLRRAISGMVMQVNTKNSFVERIEWTQKDGTVVVTEFFPPKLDEKLPAGIFEVKAEGYTWE
jgi:outer membrane lipoprotein-sorting protein